MNKQGAGKIAWTDYSWNPVSGCSKLCNYCYAAAMARRFKRSFAPTCHPERLDEPSRLKKPSRIFVASAGDLFDPAIPFDFVARVWGAMWAAPQHRFQVLTKQPARMLEFVTKWYKEDSRLATRQPDFYGHVWLGVSATCQADADERIPLLLETPAATRFVSYEPALGEVDLSEWLAVTRRWGKDWTEQTGDVARLAWVITGAMTGPGAVKPEREWVETLRRQCQAAGVPLFEKSSLAKVVDRPLVQQWPK